MERNSHGGDSTSKPDRKTIERNRRIHMNTLCFGLASLIPHHYFKTSKENVSQQDQLDLAAAYIKHLRERTEKLKEIKEQVMKSMEASSSSSSIMKTTEPVGGLSLPVVELKDLGSSIEVVLITGLNKNFMLYEVISILQQEGAEVVSASFSTVGGKIFHTLHARAIISRVGVETTRVCQRLQELISY
ncbi:transcription factor bHLH162-like [Durio zibethinus]|uniref:Transcription factor bHLH162-like n=1 Tax=Durio zibethinus TaxID=66656 RepID=A0A6P5Y5H3_DURZI|nr:transcription factor bHLH162-like [Durio zibethinus]